MAAEIGLWAMIGVFAVLHSHYCTTEGWDEDEKGIFLTTVTAAVQVCGNLCLYTTRCFSYGWDASKRECQLSTKAVFYSGHDVKFYKRFLDRNDSVCDARPCTLSEICVPVEAGSSFMCLTSYNDSTTIQSQTTPGELTEATTTACEGSDTAALPVFSSPTIYKAPASLSTRTASLSQATDSLLQSSATELSTVTTPTLLVNHTPSVTTSVDPTPISGSLTTATVFLSVHAATTSVFSNTTTTAFPLHTATTPLSPIPVTSSRYQTIRTVSSSASDGLTKSSITATLALWTTDRTATVTLKGPVTIAATTSSVLTTTTHVTSDTSVTSTTSTPKTTTTHPTTHTTAVTTVRRVTRKEKKRESFIYLACYKDKKRRLLYHQLKTMKSLSIPTCYGYCNTFRYSFFGVENKNQCFCGRRLRKGYKKLKDKYCAAPCSGDPSEHCGGYWRIAIYKIK